MGLLNHAPITVSDLDRAARFHAAALAAGGTDDGPPGPRPENHARSYAAFVRDPDGNRLEAVCHR